MERMPLRLTAVAWLLASAAIIYIWVTVHWIYALFAYFIWFILWLIISVAGAPTRKYGWTLKVLAIAGLIYALAAIVFMPSGGWA